jgi:hypothetical protein
MMFPGEVMCEGVAATCFLGGCSLLLILRLLGSLECSCKKLGRHPRAITSWRVLASLLALMFQEAQWMS